MEVMPKRQDRICRCLCYVFVTGGVWKQPHSKTRVVLKAALSNGGEMKSKYLSAQTKHLTLSQQYCCTVLKGAASVQASRLISPLQS